MTDVENVFDEHGSVKSPLLTKRQLLVVILICKQFSNKEIAGQLKLSIRTVEKHKKIIMEKTASKNIAGIVLHAIVNKLYFPLEHAA